MFRHALLTTAVFGTSAAAGLGLATPAHAAPPRTDPTITIRVGGIRTAPNGAGVPNATNLDGATFRVSGGNLTAPVTCTSVAGLCTVAVPGSSTYTVTQTGAPAGWFDNPVLGAGTVSPAAVTARPYNTLDVTVGTGDVTIPTAASNTTTSPTARSGTWALSRNNPSLPDGCGLRIALLFDLSSSITSTILPTYKAAGRAFVDALAGTPSDIAVYTFGTTAPAPNTSGTNNANLTPPLSVASPANVTTLTNKINGLGVPSSSYTNWDAGIWQMVTDNAAYHYQAAIVLTDGDPTRYGPTGNLGGVTSSVVTRFAETENGIFSANTLKNQGTTVLGVGIGTSPAGLQYTDNLRAISGPVEGTDFFNTDFAALRTVLTNLALRNCAGLDITKSASPTTYLRAGDHITYSYTVTNTHYFTLHDVHVIDDHISGPIACTPGTLATNQMATCSATYTITQADVDRGYVTNTARANGTTPNDDAVTSGPVDDTVRTSPGPCRASPSSRPRTRPSTGRQARRSPTPTR